MLGCVQSNLIYEAVGAWLLLFSVAGFLAMGLDKARAAGGEWRIPEATLFMVALAGGAFGMAVGSEVFHHKTCKVSFLAVMYGFVVIWVLLLGEIGFLGCVSTYLPR